jgi:hypothetical protein
VWPPDPITPSYGFESEFDRLFQARLLCFDDDFFGW